MSEKFDYTDLEFVITKLEAAKTLIKITLENLFDTNPNNLSPWVMQYSAPLEASVDILDRETDRIDQIRKSLIESGNSKEKK